MERDLFISYGTRDSQGVAEDIVADLEARGLVCWIAPRDIAAGSRSWAAEIVRGIRSSRNFLLLLSAGANASEEIEKELDEAARQRKPLFVIRVEDIEPSEGLGYHLNRVQWRDLFHNRELVLDEIVARALALRSVGAPAPIPRLPEPKQVPEVMSALPVATAPADPSPVPEPAARHWRTGSIIASVAAAAAASFFMLVHREPRPENSPPLPQIASAAKPPAAVETSAPVARIAPPAEEAFEVTLARRLGEISPGIGDMTGRAREYASARGHKALAINAMRESWYASNGTNEAEAELVTLEGCQARTGRPCRLVALNQSLRPAPVPDAPFGVSMPRVVYEGPFDPARIPALGNTRRGSAEITGYATAPDPRAAAFHPWGRIFVTTAAASQRQAEEAALAACNDDPTRQGRGGVCLLYAVGIEVVLPKQLTAPMTPAPPVPPSAPQPEFRIALAERLLTQFPSMSDSLSRAGSYASARSHKALAVSPSGESWFSTQSLSESEARERALESCQIRYVLGCRILALNEDLQGRPGPGEPFGLWMPRVGYDGPFDPSRIPSITDERRKSAELAAYANARGPKAVALHPWGRVFAVVNAASQRQAESTVLASCNGDPSRGGRDGPCLLYAIGGQVVLPQRALAPLTAASP